MADHPHDRRKAGGSIPPSRTIWEMSLRPMGSAPGCKPGPLRGTRLDSVVSHQAASSKSERHPENVSRTGPCGEQAPGRCYPAHAGCAEHRKVADAPWRGLHCCVWEASFHPVCTWDVAGSSPVVAAISDHSSAWQSAAFGTQRSRVRIPLIRPPSGCSSVGRARGLGPRGRRFESAHSDQNGS